MADDDERRRTFEARLAQLKQTMEAGLVGRARTLREAAERLLAGDETARRVLKTEGHKLRGIAGSYGHDHLTDLATELEKRASLSPPPMLSQLATTLAEAAEDVGHRSSTVPNEAKANTPAGPPAGARASGQPSPQLKAPSTLRDESQPPSRKRGASVQPAVRSATGGALRVLAMDDDPTTLRLLRLTLKDIGGFEAVIVTSAHEALAEMAKREFDVVVSDAMMPDMNGKEFCKSARALGDWAAHVPIVILSAATHDELGWREDLSGPTEWLRKPFMPSTLVRDIARIAEVHRKKTGP